MKKAITLSVSALLLTAGAAQAELVISVDLTAFNSITVSATDGLSAATVSGSDSIGFYLEDFYSALGAGLINSGGVGNLTSFLNTSDATPGIFRSGGGGGDPGLNIWTYTNDFTSDFTAGIQAFSGTATWSLSATEYAEAIADGNRGGDVYFDADDVGDLPLASLIGQYEVIVTQVPAPGAFALLGLAGLAGGGRRRR